MAEVVVFHSALGLRPAVVDWAERLRGAGHTVHTPDFFDGEVFDDFAAGATKRDAIGVPELMRRAAKSVRQVDGPVVYAGFSMGAAAAQWLAATRPNAQGALLMHGVVPIATLGTPAWPARVPVEIHYAASDPWVDPSAVDALVAAARAVGARVDVHTYPGSAHLFNDPGLAEYDSNSATLLLERALAFLERVTSAERAEEYADD